MTEKLILTYGLTDQNEGDWIVQSSQDFKQEIPGHEKALYNLYRMNPDVEKTTISWEINTDCPYVLRLIAGWETRLQKPHLKMMQCDSRLYPYNPDWRSYINKTEMVSLLPERTPEDQPNYLKLDITDCKNLYCNIPWGDLYYNTHQSLTSAGHNAGNVLNHLFHYSTQESSITQDLPPFDLFKDLTMATTFQWQFALGENIDIEKPVYLKYTGNDSEWWLRAIKDKPDEQEHLLSLGYTPKILHDYHKNKNLWVGSLRDDRVEAYDKFRENSTVCRVSLTKE